MTLTQSQQILEAIRRSSRPLLCIPSGGGPDAYASALGFSRILKKLEKSAMIVAADGIVPLNMRFLPGADEVRTSLDHLRQFVIELDAVHTKVDTLTYELKEDKLFIYLSPKQGFWDQTDVRTSSSGYCYDLIICMGSPDFESCAHLYAENTDFFFRTPVINIDHTPENEHYGQINAVDLTAAACGEVCHDLIESIDPNLIDEDVATAFLTGMIAKTKSFRTRTVTPKTLQTASKLIAKGAKREEIVSRLYRTRSVSTLRLWGRALARLKMDPQINLVWTMLSKQDFMHAGAHEEDLPDVVDELIVSSPQARIVVLLYENTQNNVCAIVRAERPFDVIELCRGFNASGTREEARLCFIKQSIVRVEQELIGSIQNQLAQKRQGT